MAEPVFPLPPRSEPVLRPKAGPGPVPVRTVPGTPAISAASVRPRAVDTNEQFRSRLEHSYAELQSTMSQLFMRVRSRFRFMVDERPMQVVAGVAIAAFVAGATLRIWRSNHD